MKLTAENVQAVLKDCLYSERDLPPNAVKVTGALTTFAFNPTRLEAHREDVKSMLSELSDVFMVGEGGGMSLMQMPFTKNGTQYGEQRDADFLYALGNALGYCSYCLPRQFWPALPGGMPYVQIDLSK